MQWLVGLRNMPYLPYVAIAVVVWTAGVSGYSYMKGHSTAEQKYQIELNKALKAQYEDMLTMLEQEKALALDQQRKKYELRKRISEVATPTESECSLPVECLQWYDDLMRAATAHSEGAD